jgi:hypothetical protein
VPETDLEGEIDWRANELEVLGAVRMALGSRERVPVDEARSGYGMVLPLTSSRSPHLVTETDLVGEGDEKDYAFEWLSALWMARWSRELVLGDEVLSVLPKAPVLAMR